MESICGGMYAQNIYHTPMPNHIIPAVLGSPGGGGGPVTGMSGSEEYR